MRNDWYTDFFSGLVVDFWAHAVAPAQTQLEVEFLHSLFGPAQGKCLLDVPCGHGRHALPLGKLGYRVVGVDISPDSLERAKHSANGLTGLNWQLSDMRQLPWEAEFDGAFCFGNSFGYLHPAGTREFLAAVSQTLKPGAAFVLETGASAESLLPALREQRWMEIGDILFFSSATYVCGESRLDITYSLIKNGVRETKGAHTWVLSLAEIQRMLSEAGLVPEAIYGSVGRDEFRLGSPRAILVARKHDLRDAA